MELVDLVDSARRIKQTGIPRTEVDRFPDLYLQIVIVVIFDRQDVCWFIKELWIKR